MNVRSLSKVLWLGCLLALLFGLSPLQAGDAAAETLIRWVAGAPRIDPLFSHTSIAKEMGYFKERGIDVEVTALGGGARTIPVVAAKKAEIGYVGAEPMILNAAKGKDAGIVLFFNQNRDPIFQWVVKPDSPIKAIQEVKGKSIGTLSLASSGTFYAKGEMLSLGLNPEKDIEFVVVGAGPGSMKALQRGEIGALVQVDTILASMENAGAKFRYLPKTSYTDAYFQGGMFVRKPYLKTNRKELCAFGRGIGKGVVFALANPEAAIRIHWKVYPESKPKGVSEEKAMKFSLHVLNSRIHKWDPSDELIKKHGAFSHEEWMKIVEQMGLKEKVTDAMVKSFYTNELVNCMNDFDEAKVRQQAKNFKMK